MATDAIAANRAQWEERLPVHRASEFYDVDGFRAGRTALHSIELEEVGDVAGRDLLHLQCHFGLDTLSWARLGARVTGADFSPSAVETARALAREIGVDARFVCSTIDELPNTLDARFDVVFASWGVLCWVPGVRRWATVAAHHLRPGGAFHLVEFHPVIGALSESEPARLQPWYFIGGPHPFEGDTDYADPGHVLELPTYEWVHPVGEVVTALVEAGLTVESLREHPVAPERVRPFFQQDEDGWWRVPGDPLPLAYSVRARQPRA